MLSILALLRKIFIYNMATNMGFLYLNFCGNVWNSLLKFRYINSVVLSLIYVYFYSYALLLPDKTPLKKLMR